MDDYIPRKDVDLVVWSGNFTQIITENAVEWGIPDNEVKALKTASDNFALLCTKANSSDRTSGIVAEKNAVRKTLITTIRAMAGFRLKNPVISVSARVTLGLRVRDTSPSRIPVPASRPELNVEVFDVRRLKIVFHDMNSTGKAKPYGINGAVVAFDVLDAPPASISDLTRSIMVTRTPHTLEFKESERGKTVYLAICWQNKKGQNGPWSAIKSAFVP